MKINKRDIDKRYILNERAFEILKIVNEATEWEGDVRPGSVLTRYYAPRYRDGISGAGDAAILRSLEKRGLICRPRTEISNPYVYAITEDGIFALNNGVIKE